MANAIEEHVDEISDIESKFSDVKVIDDCIKRIDDEINVTCEDDSTATIQRRGGNVNSLTEATVVIVRRTIASFLILSGFARRF